MVRPPSPSPASSWAHAGYLIASTVVVIAGVAVVDVATLGPVVSWIALALIGVLAGSLAGRRSFVWVAILAAVVASIVVWGAWAASTHRIFWWLGAAAAAALVGLGFWVGVRIGWRQTWVETTDGVGPDPRSRRRLMVGTTALLAVALVGYTGYVGVVGANRFVEAVNDTPDCRTPAVAYGWDYEAVNYDRAPDAALDPVEAPERDGRIGWTCAALGAPAGAAVVSSDGVRIAAWYVPAADGIGPDGPTVVIVPGWKANKSEILKYAPAFHDRFNLVLVDVRNVGQSGDADTTMGLREQFDVRAVVDWLVAAKGATWIALMGISMGAATSVAEAVADSRIDALILDSMHASLVVSAGNILETEHGHPSLPGSWAIAVVASWRVGGDVTTVDPVQTITRLGDRPVLLLHGTADLIDVPSESAERNLHAAMAAGVPVELHYCQGATHGAVIDRCPVDWARWADSFLDGAVVPKPASVP